MDQINAVIVTDLHGNVRSYSKEDLAILFADYDVCFLLGDNEKEDIDVLLPLLDLTKTYGILGNHDGRDLYDWFHIENIHGKLIRIKNRSFLGWEGSYKYKPNMIGMNQEESIEFEKTLPAAEYLISHDGIYNEYCNNEAHKGLKGITNYQNRTNCHILRGHIHEKYENEREHCFYKIGRIII